MRRMSVLVVVFSLVAACKSETKAAPAEPKNVPAGEKAPGPGINAAPEKGPPEQPAKKTVEAPKPEPVKATEPKKEATAEDVLRSYLEFGAKGDLAKIKDLVDPKCYDTKVGQVDAVKMMGHRLTVSKITIETKSQTDTAATMQATIAGAIHAKDAKTETTIMGKPVTLTVGTMDADGISLSETLKLVKTAGKWMVTCD